MSSTNKTPNYNLPQWVASDKPERTDFNQAMSDIDSNLNLVDDEIADLSSVLNKLFTGAYIPDNDLNNLYETGATGMYPVFTTQPAANCPITAGIVLVFARTGGMTVQLAISSYDMYHRYRTSSTWGTWRKVTSTLVT